MRPARAIVLCGLPASGKTTVGTRLATERSALRLCPDEWMRALGIDLWDQQARAQIEALQWELAQRSLQLGTSVVIEWGTWSRVERDEIRDACRALDVGVELHHLDVPVEELWQRLEVRNARPGEVEIGRDDLDRWATADFEAPTPAELALYDSPPG